MAQPAPPVPASPTKAHRHRCMYECMNRQRKAIRECDMEGQCSSWYFRMGKSPGRAGMGGRPTHRRPILDDNPLLKLPLPNAGGSGDPLPVPSESWLSDVLAEIGSVIQRRIRQPKG